MKFLNFFNPFRFGDHTHTDGFKFRDTSMWEVLLSTWNSPVPWEIVPIFAAPVHPSISNIQDTTGALHQLIGHFWRPFLDISSYHIQNLDRQFLSKYIPR